MFRSLLFSCLLHVAILSVSGGFISSVSPSAGLISGGTTVTISGSSLAVNLSDIQSISVAGVACSSFVFTSSASVSCTTHSSSSAVSGVVVVTSSTGGSSSSNELFFYECPPGAYVLDTGCFSCPPGYYSSSANSPNCTACPPGYSCSNTTATSCVAGTYSVGQQSSCTSCSSGYYNPSSTQSACQVCPPGYMCSTTTSTACVAGTYSAGQQTSCTPCSSGYYASSNTQSACQVCPPGFSCSSSTATPCVAGTYSTGQQTSCSVCSSGFFNTNTTQTACQACPAGFYCNTTTALACSAGTYSIGSQSACSACSSGTYSALTAQSVCQSCQPGSYCTTSQSYLCNAGTFSSTTLQTSCQACSAGNYAASAGATTCLTCPAGYQCSTSSITTCSAGYTSVAGSISCTALAACSAGFYRPGGIDPNCYACPSGFYQASAGASSCNPCSPGYYCPNATTSLICSAGYYSSGLATVCTACAAGTYATSSGASSCLSCPAGYSCANRNQSVACSLGYFSSAGSGACSLCPAGMTSNSPIADHCVACPAGKVCTDPTKTPSFCPSGYWSPLGINTQCNLCPAGYACPINSTSVPTACNLGYYSTSGQTNCTICPAGYACAVASSSPALCAAGTYSSSGDYLCHACPPGKSCANPASITTCSSGTYALESSSNCTVCPAGYMCPSTSFPPILCASGYYSTTGQTSCLICPAGYSCSSGASGATLCPSGSYSPNGSLSCFTCPAGYACPSLASAPVACAVGTYSVGNAISCTSCPAGFQCPYTDAAGVACAPGTYSGINQSVCTVCSAGKMCPTPSSTPVTCTSGTFSLAGQSNCTACPNGWACPALNGSQNIQCVPGQMVVNNLCQDCPAGYACPYLLNAQISCSAGSYSGARQVACQPCPPGYSCAVASASPVLCTAGTFSIGNATACTACPAGFKCTDPTSNNYVACLEGTFSIGNSTTCTVCPAGQYCNVTTTAGVSCLSGYFSSAGQSFCSPCPAGYQCSNPALPQICPTGTYSTGFSTSCTSCSLGTYNCPAGGVTPIPTGFLCPAGGYCPTAVSFHACPAGTYSSTVGNTNSSACITCNAGVYCPTGTTDIQFATPCALGHYCPAGSTNSTAVACSSGTYNPSLGATDSTWCQTCPSGYSCPQASSNSSNLCPSGYYCPAGVYPPQACPAGTYTGYQVGLTDSSLCLSCPPGSWCPAASIQPTACSQGTFNPNFGGSVVGNCISCTAGMSCPTTGLAAPSKNCSAGYYCPSGTIFSTTNPCPAGYYSDSQSLVASSQCLICPAGFSCASGTGGQAKPWQLCGAGYYCPLGTTSPTQYPCPAGTYSTATNLKSASDCSVCPAGSYCIGGLTVISGSCSAGYYCPAGSSSSTAYPCPAGTYSALTNLSYSDQCTYCPLGFICSGTANTKPTACLAGTYTNATHTGGSAYPTCSTCPAGYYCLNQTSSPAVCGQGKYSAAGASSCSTCPVGYYCASNTTSQAQQISSPCVAGLYCPAGMTQQPDAATESCPVGKYCVQATTSPQNCSAGTYNPRVGAKAQSDCVTCPPGYVCNGGLSTWDGLCPAGYYCSSGTSTSTITPCRAGTYRSIQGGDNSAACATCPAGFVCNTTGMSTPQNCPAGSYCLPGSTVSIPCPAGTFGNTTGLRDLASCTSCSPGMYCDITGLTAPRGLCAPGYYCSGGAVSSAPGVGGGTCPAGGYCSAGSSSAQFCPGGSYNNASGASSASNCASCPPGFYCAGSRNVAPTGMCAAGYYCTGGSSTPAQYQTPAGYYSLSGASQGTPCPSGQYNSQTGQSSCLNCPAGFFCPNQSMTQFFDCPAGSYCPIQSISPSLCPPGTYSTQTNLINSSQCTSCLAGQYCSSYGATTPTASCFAGYYCLSGAHSPVPTDGVTGNVCPAGYYCTNGTYAPSPCLAGTYSSSTGLTSSSQCSSCPPGSYCNTSGLNIPSGGCSAGFYCTSGAKSPNPTDSTGGICPIGSYCPSNSSSPLGCPAGTYMNTTGAAACLFCPAGQRCPANSVTPLSCSVGSYCPQGTNASALLCPAGTYSASISLSAASQCTPCPPGMYCATWGLSTPTGNCSAGYICLNGSINALGNDGSVTSRPCPAGSYCVSGSYQAQPCPVGTYSSSTENPSLSSCLPCPGGKYCNTTGLTSYSGLCSAGYECISAATISTPPGDATGGACPSGSYSTAGSSSCSSCNAGTYNNLTAQSACFTCLQGFYCLYASTSLIACPAGYYCPSGTSMATQYPCQTGTYSSSTSLTSSSQCIPCPIGMYCGTNGATNPTGNCSAGYYCTGSSVSATPSSSSGTGGACASGTYCPSGSSQPTYCPAGMYCYGSAQGYPSGFCWAGYYCTGNSTSPNPSSTTGALCSAGTFCPNGSSVPTVCPTGTFAASTGNTNLSACLPCTAGYYCNQTTLSAPQGLCPAGFYCPSGTISPTSVCQAGYQCPIGSIAPQACQAGYYQDASGQSSCKNCPAGSYCSGLASTSYTTCPIGSYCPLNTQYATQYLCPNGTFGNLTQLSSLSECLPCTPGWYCMSTINTAPTGLCYQGYYCSQGAASPVPTDAVTGNICPAGFYCPMGSIVPTACSTGTYASGTGHTNSSSCSRCPPGLFCASSGSSALSSTLCNPGYVCLGGAISPSPTDGVTGFACTPGNYCPSGSSAQLQCPPGQYNPNYAQGSCLTCPAGQVCAGSGNVNFTNCPLGYYCPANTSIPTPCPAGSYGTLTKLSSSSGCQACDPGMYCDGTNITGPTGACAAGFVCTTGAPSPTPSGVYPLAGPCPAGSYCPAGTLTPIPCPVGTLNPNTGAANLSACDPCTAGFYCATTGLVTPTAACSSGYWCPSSSSSPTQVACPMGFYCGLGTVTPSGCPNGTYNPFTAQSTCLSCPAGYYCTFNCTSPLTCPIGYYCPGNTFSPIPCPNGTYGTVSGLATSAQCAACPAGVYCRGGFVAGNCTAGFLCLSENGDPNPTTWSSSTGGPCPAGNFCPTGTQAPLSCSNGTVRASTGGASPSDCEACPAGSLCIPGDPIPFPCPVGYYCALNAQPVACPIGTYGPSTGGQNSSSCLVCPAGYWCKTTGMSDYSSSLCPSGSYCNAGITSPQPCPAGSFRSSVGGVSSSSCASCPAGSYCPQNSSIFTPCPSGYYCPANSGSPGSCPAGSYCPASSSQYISCPSGFYCPANSSTPIACVSGYYCPASSWQQTLCPLGYHANTAAIILDSQADACIACPPGYYSTDPNRQNCTICTAGYVCLGATTSATPQNASSDRGYVCPAGFYCPAGSSVETACPAGFYNPNTGATNASFCLPCAANSYSSSSGMSSCRPCGSSAWSLAQATSCNCNGTYRAYQISDGSCLCQTGYEYFDVTGSVFYGDSSFPCQPIVYADCSSGTIRAASQGTCIDASNTAACSSACNNPSGYGGSNGGTYHPELGVCICNNAVPVSSVCNTSCQALSPVVSLSSSNAVTITKPSAGTVQTASLSSLTGYTGTMTCSKPQGCAVINVIADSTGQTAVYGLPPVLSTVSTLGVAAYQKIMSDSLRIFGSRTMESSAVSSYIEMSNQFRTFWNYESDDSYHGSSTSLSSSYGNNDAFSSPSLPNFISFDYVVSALVKSTGFANPTICLQQGDSFLFDLSAGLDNYPVYDVNNLLNTNPNFDYTAFRNLAAQIAANLTQITMFGFTFTTQGTYVFYASAQPTKFTIVVVLPLSQTCPSSGSILATSGTTLTQLGVTRTSNVTVAPNLVYIAAFIMSFLGVAVVIAFYTRLKQARYFVAIEDGTQNADEGAPRQEFIKLYKKLEEQRTLNDNLFDSQKRDFHSECDRLVAETEQVKALLAAKMVGGNSNRAFVDAAERLLLAEISARNSYDRRQRKREEEVFELLNNLHSLLRQQEAVLDVNKVTDCIQEIVGKIHVLQEAIEKERTRRRGISSNAGIIGDDVLAELSAPSFDENNAESALLSLMVVFGETAEAARVRLADAEQRYTMRKQEMTEMRNSGLDQLTHKHERNVRAHCKELEIHLDQVIESLKGKQTALEPARLRAKQAQDSAKGLLDQRKAEADRLSVGETGLFRGINSDLAHALEVFLAHSAKDLLVVPAQGKSKEEAISLLRQPSRTIGLSGEESKDQPGMPDRQLDNFLSVGSSIVQSPSVDVIMNESQLEIQLDEVKEETKRQAEEERTQILNALALRPGVTAEDIARVDRDLQKKNIALFTALEAEQKRVEEERVKELERQLEPQEQLLLSSAIQNVEKLKQKHEIEEKKMESSLENEASKKVEEEAKALDRLEHEIEEKRSQIIAEMEAAQSVQDGEERSLLLKEHQVQLRKLDDSLQEDREKSAERLKKLHADLRNKKAKQRAILKSKQQQELKKQRSQVEKVRNELEKKKQATLESIPGLSSLEVLVNASAGAASSSTAEHQAMQREHLRLRQELEQEQQSEKKVLHEQVSKEEEKLIDQFQTQTEEKRRAAVAAKQQDFETEMAARAASSTAEEVQELVAQHEKEMQAFAQKLDMERDRQKQKLDISLASKRKEKEEALRIKHQAAMQHELKQQKQEMKEASYDSTKKKELEILKRTLGAENRRKAKGIIERVIKPRRRKEKADLLTEQWQETTSRLTEALTEMFDRLQSERAELMAQKDAGDITAEEYEAKMLELDATEVDADVLQAQIALELEPSHQAQLKAHNRAELQEVQDIFREFYPDENFSSPEWQLEQIDMRSLLAEAATKRKKEEEQITQEIARLKQEEGDFKAEQERKLQEAMREYDVRLEEERKRNADEMERRMRAQQEIVLREKEELNKQKLASLSNVDADQKRAIMEQHQQEMDAQRQAQELELARQREKMNEKLKAQQEAKRRREFKRQQEQQSALFTAERDRKRQELDRLESMKKEHADRIDQIIKDGVQRFLRKGQWRNRVRTTVLRAAARLRERHVFSRARAGRPSYVNPSSSLIPFMSPAALIADHEKQREAKMAGQSGLLPVGAISGAGLSSVAFSADGVALPQGARINANDMSPFFDRLSNIESSLAKMLQAEGMNMEEVARKTLMGEIDHMSPGEFPFVDALEARLKSEGKEAVVCDISELTVKSFVVYRYGRFIIDLIASVHHIPGVQLLLVRNLPLKSKFYPSSNAFRNSYHFDSSTRTLMVRVERTEDVGGFTLVLLHALAHVRVMADSQFDDTHSGFKREFYHSLRVVCGELFFSRSQSSRKSAWGTRGKKAGNQGDVATNDKVERDGEHETELDLRELRSMFGLIGMSEAGKEEAVDDYLNLTQAQNLHDEFNSPDELLDRLEQYKMFAHSTKVRQQLAILEEEMGSKITQTLKDSMTEDLLEFKIDSSNRADAPSNSSRQSQQRLIELHIEKLELQNDKLNQALLHVVVQIKRLSENLMKLQALVPPPDPQSSVMIEANNRLRRLNTVKDTLRKRMADVEKRLSAKKTEFLSA